MIVEFVYGENGESVEARMDLLPRPGDVVWLKTLQYWVQSVEFSVHHPEMRDKVLIYLGGSPGRKPGQPR